jgi:hypothetical protein
MTEVSSLIASAMQMVATGKNANHWFDLLVSPNKKPAKAGFLLESNHLDDD